MGITAVPMVIAVVHLASSVYNLLSFIHLDRIAFAFAQLAIRDNFILDLNFMKVSILFLDGLVKEILGPRMHRFDVLVRHV